MHARRHGDRMTSLSLALALLASACDDGNEQAPAPKADSTKAENVGAQVQEGAKVEAGAKTDAKADANEEVPTTAVEPEADAGGGGGADGGEGVDTDSGGEPEAGGGDAKKPDPTSASPKGGSEDPAKTGKAPRAKAAAAGDSASADGKDLFQKKCASCHGATGKGDTKLGQKYDIPDWSEPGWKAKWPLAKIKNVVTNGEPGTKMKAFKDKLTPDEIDAVSKYALSLGK